MKHIPRILIIFENATGSIDFNWLVIPSSVCGLADRWNEGSFRRKLRSRLSMSISAFRFSIQKPVSRTLVRLLVKDLAVPAADSPKIEPLCGAQSNRTMRFSTHLIGLFAALGLSCELPAEPAHRVVYYVNGHGNWLQWWPPSQLRLAEMTHVIWFQPGFTPANDPLGFISPAHQVEMKATIRRCRDAGVKILYGYAAGFETIRPVLESPAQRDALADDLVRRVKQYDFDGLDIDVEYAPNNTDAERLGEFIAGLRQRLGRRPLLTAAVASPTWGGSGNTVGTVPWHIIRDHCDWANVMAYGAGNSNRLSFAEQILTQYADMGVPRSKLVLGSPFYGKVAPDPDEPQLGGNAARSWRELAGFLDPYDEGSDDIVFTLNGHTYRNPVVANNRETQRLRARRSIELANGSMIWVANGDSTDPLVTLGTPLWETASSHSMMIDGFEIPPKVDATGAYLTGGGGGAPSNGSPRISLTGTRERVHGDAALTATFRFSGKSWDNAWFRHHTGEAGWEFPATATLRLEVNAIQPEPRGTFYLRLYDTAGRRAQSLADAAIVRSSGWKRRSFTRTQFDQIAEGFDWNAIRQVDCFIQLAGNTDQPPSEAVVLFDQMILIGPGALRPQAYDRDGDGDTLPDRLETALGSDSDSTDSNGDGIFDGHAALLTGSPLVAPAPLRLERPANGMKLVLPGAAGALHRIESSVDLTQWTFEAEIATTGPQEFFWSVPPGGNSRFFRSRPAH